MSDEPTVFEGGHFSYHGSRSPRIICGDVFDRFPCAHCRAGMDGTNLRCRDMAQRDRDYGAYQDWNTRPAQSSPSMENSRDR